MVKISVKDLVLKEDGTAVANIKQKSGGNMPITVSVTQLHKQFPRMKHINSLKVLVALIKKKGGTIELPNIKMGDKREKRLEARKEEQRWSSE